MILPKEIIENSSNAFHYKYETRSKVIYSIIVLFLIGVSIALPYLKTDIYVTGVGIIKPSVDRKEVVSPNSGYITFSKIENNQSVLKGDTLLVIDDLRISEQIDKLQNEKALSEENISDFDYLLFSRQIERSKIQSPANRSNYLKYEQQLRQINYRIERSLQVLERQTQLHNQKVISNSEIEKFQFEHKAILNEKEQIMRDQRFLWDNERRKEQMNLAQLESQLTTLSRNLNEFTLIASISGTIFNAKGIEQGNYVNTGELLAEISPNTDLTVEVLIPPSKVGLINTENEVRYQVDAYNYNNWGFASGKITDISKDLEIVNNQAVFKIRGSLNETHLSLKNGFEGELKKGLTLRARFKVTERSLFDLLYDKVDNWLNPAQDNITAQN